MPPPQHITEWRQAAKATTEQEWTPKENAFTTRLQQLHQPQPPNTLKEWYKATTVVLAKYPTVSVQDVSDVTSWVNALRTKLNIQVSQLHPIIDTLHANQVAMGATARKKVEDWIDSLPPERRTFGKVNQLILALKSAGFDNKRIRSLWQDLGATMGGNVLATILGDPAQVPPWLDRASRHVAAVQAPQFWMGALQNNKEEIVHYAPVVYAGNLWQTAGQQVNATASLWASVHRLQRLWVDMFNIAQWLEMQDVIGQSGQDASFYLPKLAEIGELMPAQRKNRDNRAAQTVQATLADMGAWIHHHRELVIELLANGYSAEVITEMYTEELEHREIVTATWFRGQPITNINVEIGFKPYQSFHGYIFAKYKHVAERHLYRHFDFQHQPRFLGDEAIKDLNSFFPSDTTQQQVSLLADTIFIGNDNDLVTVGQYVVFIRQTDLNNAHTRRVESFYPDLANGHRDKFTRDKLERIKAVAAKFATPYSNDKPVIAWRDAPRPRR